MWNFNGCTQCTINKILDSNVKQRKYEEVQSKLLVEKDDEIQQQSLLVESLKQQLAELKEKDDEQELTSERMESDD